MISIYLDVLIITNVYVNYFLVKGVARFTHTALSSKRCAAASLIGALSSLMILLPSIDTFIILAYKIIVSVTVILVAFKWSTVIRFLKLNIVMLAFNLIYAGLMAVACDITHAGVIIVNNYCVYINISLLVLLISTIISYIIVCIIGNIADKKHVQGHCYTVKVELLGKEYEFEGVSDTGNTLTDVFSGKPVIIINCSELASLANLHSDKHYTSEDYARLFKIFRGLRLMPYSTIGNNGVLLAFLADSIKIIDEKNNEKEVNAYIGLINNNSKKQKAIFNPRLLF